MAGMNSKFYIRSGSEALRAQAKRLRLLQLQLQLQPSDAF